MTKRKLLAALLGTAMVLLLLSGCPNPFDESNGMDVPASLAGLTVRSDIGGLTLSPAFDSNVTDYSVIAGPNEATLFVTARAEDSDATVLIEGTSSPESIIDHPVAAPDAGSQKTVTITVSGTDDSKNYVLSISRQAASAEARLQNLQVDTGEYGGLDSTFDPDTTEYDLTVADSYTSVEITPTLQDTQATVTIEGETAYHESLKPVTIPTDNTIEIVVTAADNATTETYTLNVVRPDEIPLADLTFDTGTLTPSLTAGTYSYTLEIPEGTTSVAVTPTSDTADIIRVNGQDLFQGTVTLYNLPLSNNPIEILLLQKTAGNFVYSETTYSVQVQYPAGDDATLSDLSVTPGRLAPGFEASTSSYQVRLTLSGNNAETSIDVTPTTNDPNATVTVDGQSAASGSATSISLSGEATIDVVVTAEDGATTETYSIELRDSVIAASDFTGRLGVPLAGENLLSPTKLAVDEQNNVYVVDTTGRGVHKFDSAGNFVQLITYTDMESPADVAVDTSSDPDTLYVADEGDTVFTFEAEGTYLSSFDGTTGGGEGFDSPQYIAVDPNGNVYVLDKWTDYIHMLDSSGSFVRKIGESDTDIDNAYGIAAGDGVVYAGNWFTDTVKSYDTSDGSFSTFTTVPGDPYGIDVDDAGNVYVVVRDGSVYKYDATTGNQQASYGTGGSGGSGDGEFSDADGIAVDGNGNIIVADTGNGRVQKLNGSGGFVTSFGQLDQGQIGYARDFAADADSNVYVLDSYRELVQVFDTFGAYQRSWSVGSGDSLTAIAVDRSNDAVYVGESSFSDGTVYEYDLNGNAGLTINGSGSTFNGVDALAVDPSNGNIYVADGTDITYYQNTSSPSGNFGSLPSTDDMMFNSDNELLVGDSGGDQIRAFTQNGANAGIVYDPGTFEGSFYVDEQGFLYIPDKDFSGYELTYYDPDSDQTQWTLELETFGTTISGGPAPIEIAPDGTLYIQAQYNEDGILIYKP